LFEDENNWLDNYKTTNKEYPAFQTDFFGLPGPLFWGGSFNPEFCVLLLRVDTDDTDGDAEEEDDYMKSTIIHILC